MLNRFKKYLEENNLIRGKGKVLLAVSGGIDSIVLVHLFKQSNIEFDIAHCNFCLRGKDAKNDQEFVEAIAKKLNVTCHVKLFQTDSYAKKNGVSIQMAARDLRYSWFNQLVDHQNYSCIAVGTHLNDSIETFLLNAAKGTGISGLKGIKSINGNIIRPLLFASKKEIETYALKKKIEFRTDKSNDSLKYLRNKIRHQIVPVLEKINPSFETTFKQNFENLSFVETVYLDHITTLKKQLVRCSEESINLDFDQLKKLNHSEHYLYELVKSYGFTFKVCQDIVRSSTSGKQFFSKEYQLIVDRTQLILQKIKGKSATVGVIHQNSGHIDTPLPLSFEEITVPSKLKVSSKIALIDYEKLVFPLEIRPWRSGDFFYPLGMNQKKKLSDFFIDNKLSLFEKDKTFVLTSREEIVWIIGRRLDNRFKIEPSTNKVLRIIQD
jgi:tRNA(Ile)-lysidine synthase